LDIDSLRTQINQLDNDLLRIFNERAALALKIGELKKSLDLPIYDPRREKLIFERIQQQNQGPLDNAAIIRLFERVIDESRNLERAHAKGQD
jgi:chorismate mutase